MDFEKALHQKISNQINENNLKKQEKPKCSLLFIFDDESKISSFKNAIEPIISGFKQKENYLVKIMPDRDSAQKMANEINTILSHYNDAIIEQDFKSDWLSEFLNEKDYGIRHIMPDHILNSEDKIESHISKRLEDDLKTNEYTDKKKEIKLLALNYSDKQMMSNWFEFIDNNFTGIKTRDLGGVLRQSFEILKEESSNKFFFSRFPAQQILHAIDNKSDHIHADQNYKEQRKENKLFESFCQNFTHDDWKSITSKLEHVFSEQFSNIKIKDTQSWTSFNGPQAKNTEALDINKRLSPARFNGDISRTGYSPANILSGAIVAYFTKMAEFKQEANFEKELINYSKNMDKSTIVPLSKLAEKSRPYTSNADIELSI